MSYPSQPRFSITELYLKVTKIHEVLSDEFVSRLPYFIPLSLKYEGWNFNSGNYLFTTDTK